MSKDKKESDKRAQFRKVFNSIENKKSITYIIRHSKKPIKKIPKRDNTLEL